MTTGSFKPDLPYESWFGLLEKARMIGFDWETTGLDVYDCRDKPLGFSVSVAIDNDVNNIVSEYFPVNHSHGNNAPQEAWEYILYLVTQSTAVMHNALFDMAVTKQLGFNLDKVFCTMRFDHLLNENNMVYSLEAVSKRWTGASAKARTPMFEMALLTYGWDMPVEFMRPYALSDADGTLRTAMMEIAGAQKAKENKLPEYWKRIENPNHHVLSYMRSVGVKVDVDMCRKMEQKGLEVQEKIADHFGFNPGSPVGLKTLLIDTLGYPVVKETGAGKPSFDKHAMELYEPRLAADGSEVGRLLSAYRGWSKAVSSYYVAYQRHVSPDGRLRPQYKTNGTKTGRYSCSEPNLQQIPKETNKEWNGAIKDCLISSEGYVGVEIDYSQLEFRLLASFARIGSLIEIFSDPSRDIFTEMSKQLGYPRQTCKTVTYLTIYGGGRAKLALTLGISEEEAANILSGFYSAYPEMKTFSYRIQEEIQRQGYTELWSGRRRHIPNRGEAYKGMNSLIQGGGADIVKAVMNILYRELVADDCRILLQVHDSLWFEIKEEKADEYLPQIIDIMNSPSEMLGVPLAVDAHPWSHREARKIEEANERATMRTVLKAD